MHSEASTDDGGIVDGVGTFWRSPISIFRYGPNFVAKFSAKYTDGNGISGRENASNFDVRITQPRDSNSRGKHWRYPKIVFSVCVELHSKRENSQTESISYEEASGLESSGEIS
jgi:hypothetical protein